jgi:hypothetical protein
MASPADRVPAERLAWLVTRGSTIAELAEALGELDLLIAAAPNEEAADYWRPWRTMVWSKYEPLCERWLARLDVEAAEFDAIIAKLREDGYDEPSL